MEHALCEAIAHLNYHVKEINKMYEGGEIDIDALNEDIRELSETICKAGEAREDVKEAQDYMSKHKGGMSGSGHTLSSSTSNPGVRRGISVK